MVLHHGGFPIRKSADHGLFAAPRSLSQLVTSFIGSWCQGIHSMLFVAWTFAFSSLCLESQIIVKIVYTVFSSPITTNCSSNYQLYGKTCIILIISRFSQLSVRLYFLFSLFGFQWTFVGQSLIDLWWAQVDSNHRPRAYQARALTTWAMSP